MMRHTATCTCPVCLDLRINAVAIEPEDLEVLANAWAKWMGDDDREAVALRAGNTGAPGSPRWVALQAIATSRLSTTKEKLDD